MDPSVCLYIRVRAHVYIKLYMGHLLSTESSQVEGAQPLVGRWGRPHAHTQEGAVLNNDVVGSSDWRNVVKSRLPHQ